MITPVGMISIVVGIIVCFSGYSMFRSMLPLWGFILGGAAAMYLAPLVIKVPEAQRLWLDIGSFVVGGVLGAVLASPLYYVTIFASGAAMGALSGMVFGAYLQISSGEISVRALRQLAGMTFPPRIESAVQVFLMVALGLIIGAAALSFQKFMITASTAFLGSAAVVSGFTGTITQALQGSPSQGVWMIVGWLLLGMLGMFIQFRMRDET